jgi:hypothetical protein
LGDLILVVLVGLVLPALMMVPYLREARRFYGIVAQHGWQPPALSANPARWFGPTMRNRQAVWSKAELGDYGPEAEQSLASMRRKQVVGLVFAAMTWGFGFLILGQIH